MILLYQDTTNNAYLTLSESVTLTATPIYYLFRFVDETTKDEVLFTAPDESTNTIRYNQFAITLTANTAHQNFTAGTITLNPEGRWTYEVYNMTGQTNLDISQTTGGIIEQGYVTVSGSSLSSVVNEYTGGTATWYYRQL